MSGAGLVAIDPGVAAGCAVALFYQGALAGVRFARARSAQVLDGLGVTVVVVERPEYQGARSLASRVQDLLALSWEGAALAAWYAGRAGAELVELTPSQWKGSEPKPIHHARLWAQLTLSERAILGGDATGAAIERAVEKGALSRWARPGASYYPRAFVTHNQLDAVALGCHYLGRLPRR